MGNIKANHGYSLEINTAPTAQTATMKAVAEGFDNIAEALNEVLYQSSFLGDDGWGTTEITGGQLVLSLSGVRVVGDAAQDYIFSDDVQFAFGTARNTTAALNTPDGMTITCPVTLANITRTAGAANNATAVSVEIHFNGKPTITATPTPTP